MLYVIIRYSEEKDRNRSLPDGQSNTIGRNVSGFGMSTGLERH